MPDAARIRCLIADDHEALRAGLIATIAQEDDIEVVGQAADGRRALALVDRRGVDVAVLDLLMPGLDGVEVCRRIKEAHPEVAVLIYTADDRVESLRAALDAGARGFVVKVGPLTEVVRAVRLLARGETYIESTMVTALLAHERETQRPVLSERETQVLQLLADGLTTETVAAKLFLSPTTVRSYAETAMQKLGARNRTQAVAAAIRSGFIS